MPMNNTPRPGVRRTPTPKPRLAKKATSTSKFAKGTAKNRQLMAKNIPAKKAASKAASNLVFNTSKVSAKTYKEILKNNPYANQKGSEQGLRAKAERAHNEYMKAVSAANYGKKKK